MTKKQLIKKLEKVNDNTEIILSSDGEGNSYSRLCDVCNSEDFKYFENNGEIEFLDKEDVGDSCTIEDYNKAKNCVVLYPE